MYAHTMYVIYFDYIFHYSFTVYPQSTINPFQLHILSLRQILIWTAHILVGVCSFTGAWTTWQEPQLYRKHIVPFPKSYHTAVKAIIQQLGVEAHEPVTALCWSVKCLELSQLLRGDHSCPEFKRAKFQSCPKPLALRIFAPTLPLMVPERWWRGY